MYPQVFGKYVLEREVGRGGMARIMLATLRGAGGFEKKLVVKQIREELVDAEFVRRFVEEAKTTVALSHPNIVPVYELGVEHGTYFLAMELVEGLSLDQLLRSESRRSGKALSPEEGAYIGVEVCRALSYAHRRMSVVHRDITPRNVMIDEEGQVKLIDFGIAAPALVLGQEVFGSPGHMPPEQVRGDELGPPTDIFAVAVLLMEAWSGEPPFRRKTMEECDAAMLAPHPRPSGIDPRLLPLDEALLRAMTLEPRTRQQDADELGRSLRGFLTGIDLADVARSLGERVHDARKAASAREGDEPKKQSAERAPSQAEVFTQTFAARDEVDKWSSVAPGSDKPGSEAEGSPALSTRRLAQSTPPFPATRPLPDEDDSRVAGSPSARESDGGDGGDRADGAVETIATRPIETPVRARPSVLPKARDAGRKGAVQGAAAVVVAALALWWVVAQPGSAPTSLASVSDASVTTFATTPTSTTQVTTTPGTASAAPQASVSAAATPSSATSGATDPQHPITPIAPPQSTSSASTSPSGGAATGSASGTSPYLQLFGTPGTRVSIDGQAARPCPARLATTPGSHDIRFLFDQTGESRGERLTLKPGEHVTLRADFTQAVPTLQIQR